MGAGQQRSCCPASAWRTPSMHRNREQTCQATANSNIVDARAFSGRLHANSGNIRHKHHFSYGHRLLTMFHPVCAPCTRCVGAESWQTCCGTHTTCVWHVVRALAAQYISFDYLLFFYFDHPPARPARPSCHLKRNFQLWWPKAMST